MARRPFFMALRLAPPWLRVLLVGEYRSVRLVGGEPLEDAHEDGRVESDRSVPGKRCGKTQGGPFRSGSVGIFHDGRKWRGVGQAQYGATIERGQRGIRRSGRQVARREQDIPVAGVVECLRCNVHSLPMVGKKQQFAAMFKETRFLDRSDERFLDMPYFPLA